MKSFGKLTVSSSRYWVKRRNHCTPLLSSCVAGLATTAGDPSPSSSIRAQVVICGGGLVGVSTAFHLAKDGVKDIILLEQKRLGSGGTHLSNGLGSKHCLWMHPQVQELAKYSAQLYSDLNAAHSIDLTESSRVFLCHTEDTALSFRRMNSVGEAMNTPCRLLNKSDIEALKYPCETKDLIAGLIIEEDYRLNPIALCEALAAEAVKLGVRVLQNTRAKAVYVGDTRQLYGVDTDAGYIECNTFIDAGGLWSGAIKVNGLDLEHLRVPMLPCRYAYVTVNNFPGRSGNEMPVIHDIDEEVYLTSVKGQVMAGGFRKESTRPEFVHVPAAPELCYQELEPDWDLFYSILDHLQQRFPDFGQATVDKLISGAECYSADGNLIVGQVPQIKGYYVGTGLNGLGVSIAGGVGRILSEWIRNGGEYLATDVSRIDVARFLDAHSNLHYLQQRTPEACSLSFKNTYHSHQCKTARNLRKSPIFEQLKEAGAVFGETMGYERPLYFVVDRAGNKSVKADGQESLLGKPPWFSYVAKEYEACRERVGMIDMSHFAKFEIFSEDDEVVKFLQFICSANVDKPVGTTVYTGMQHAKGGYVTDCTLSRISHNHYFVIAPTVQQVRLKMWLEHHLPAQSRVVIQDVTSMYTSLNVLGPSSRPLLQDLTDQPMGPTDFPAFSCKLVDVGNASGVRAISVTHCGELGWVLYIPNEFAQHVHDELVEAGKEYGIQHAGYLTLRQLRIEKFYVYWGMDIDSTTTPLECGRLFRVDPNKDFLGKEAVLGEKKTGVKRRYIQLLLDRHNFHSDPWPQGNEPIYRNGEFCGFTTTAGYGFTLQCQVCLGYVEKVVSGERCEVSTDFVVGGNAQYEVDIGGRRFSARANLHSPILPMISSEHPTHYRPTQ